MQPSDLRGSSLLLGHFLDECMAPRARVEMSPAGGWPLSRYSPKHSLDPPPWGGAAVELVHPAGRRRGSMNSLTNQQTQSIATPVPSPNSMRATAVARPVTGSGRL